MSRHHIPPASLAARARPHLALIAPVAGLAAAGLGARPPGTAATATALLAVLAAAAGPRAVAGPLVLAALLLAGLVFGAGRMTQTAPPELRLSAPVATRVVVEGGVAPRRTGGWRAFARPGAPMPDAAGRMVRPRLLLRSRTAAPVAGDVLDVQGRLQPAARDGDPAWWRRYLARNGVAATLDAVRVVPVGRRGGLAGRRDDASVAMRRPVERRAPVDVAAVVTGITIGADERLPERTRDAFRDAGLAHLLAVSGQNVALVAVCAVVVLGVAGLPRFVALLAAAAVIVGYALLCQPGASVGRAAVVGLVAVLAEAAGRPRHRWYALLVALLVLLAWQPRSIGDPGLLLSFAAVAGILGLAPAIARALDGRMPRPLGVALAVSAAAELATAPVSALLFGRLPVLGVMVNLLAVPLAGVVLIAGLTGSLLAVVFTPFALPPLWVAIGGAQLLVDLAEAAAAAPFAAVTVPGWAAPVAGLPALAVAAWAAWGSRRGAVTTLGGDGA